MAVTKLKLTWLLAVVALGGCANQGAPTSSGSDGGVVVAAGAMPAHAQCLVCKKNADLACIDVDVDAKTPWTDYNGKRYYFCSDECKAEFVKTPGKFTQGK